MDDLFLSVKRTPGGLVAVLSRRQNDYWNALYSDNLVELLEMYTFAEEPHEYIKKIWPDYNEKYSASWEALSTVRTWNADLLYHVLKVLINTAPVFPESNLRLPVLDLETPQPLPKKTAANPRGVLARKGKKQKPKSIPEIDLRPYLCDPKNVSAILFKLKPFWKEVMKRFQKNNPTIFFSAKPPAFTVEPYLAFRHPGSGNVKRTELPPKFAQYFLIWLTDLPWKKVKAFLSIYHELKLEHDETLLGAAVRLLASSELEQALAWLRIARDLPSGKRYSFLLILIEREAWNIDFKFYPPKAIRDLCMMIPYSHLENRLDDLFLNIDNHISLSFLEAGFKLAEQYGWDNHLALGCDCPAYPVKKVEDLIQWLNCKSSWMALSIWKNFSTHRDWGSIILRPEWNQYPSKTAKKFVERFLLWVDDHKRGELKKQKALRFLLTIDKALETLPQKYHSDFLSHLAEIYEDLYDKDLFEKYLQPICDLLIRLSDKAIPYSSLNSLTPLTTFIQLTRGNARQRFLNSPSSSFLKLNKFCENVNKMDCVSWGLYNLIDHLPELTVDLFIRFPGKLIKTANRLGTMKFINRHKAVQQFTRHPLLKVEIENISPKRLHQLIEKYRQPDMIHPVPRKLQDHFKGKITLSDSRILGYHEKSKTNFLSFVLDVLDQHILDTLSLFHPAAKEKENWEHALQFLNWVDSNRRGFKSFLKAYFGGDNHYVENHPATKRWFSKHKKINRDLWNQGILFCRKTSKYGPVRIELEKDPLEILKMGTYVGSCLSLGGSYAYSAVAVLLDLNKQVLYARDQNNRVLGRQLVALSEKDELVCFDIYPVNSTNIIKNLFFEYDIDFAKALDIDLYEGDFSKHEDGYPIQRILSKEWWNDGAWDKIAPY